jgi:serine/threonine protein kinase
MKTKGGNTIKLAMKTLELPPKGDARRDKVLFETTMIARLPKHPNIVRYLGYRELAMHVFIGMELCDDKLPKFLQRKVYSSGSVTQRSIARWKMAEQLGLGLAITHRYQIIHRDLKPDNSMLPCNQAHLVLFKVDKQKFVWKLADFGIAQVLRTPNQKINEVRGTQKWMAPEMLEGRGYTTQADMYSIGLVLKVAHQNDSGMSSQWTAAQSSLTNRNPSVRWTARQLYRNAKDALESKKRDRRAAPKRPSKISQLSFNQLGAPFKVLSVNARNSTIVAGDPRKLTSSILRQTARVIRMFKRTTKRRVQGIDYIFNPELYADFEAVKKELKQKGRYKKREFLTFHGTKPGNVNRWWSIYAMTDYSILANGLRIGGEAGHVKAVGDKKVS